MGSAPRLFSSAWSAYSSALRSHPLTTNIVTSGCITVASDTIAQTVSKGDECRPFPHYIDPKRTLTMLGWGTAVSGFGMFHWFKFLERLIPSENITPGKIAAKVLINQIGLAPTLNGGFFGVSTARHHDLGTAEGRGR
ncbi:hypothetical protein GUITHDRAFT_70145 [Guillardia theta CCMP2712]|uniref:Uncharacterized protein n=1 Tax=Guillardia theta (strain CCMP2712) TaxID=905079 RepID=L1JFL4_GUITC|nr:hypothetical protein GUITHDRAFT_70145 [Guillardia theta CCMP2712]EKX46890.1 hypothetical protein GUITHDRAFT_70145 [Guillardia theta CCMP2712]|eukprot:XP_005833870.1 hypothetical protein GUITHDRAFT_70145 [Guillardia theta CCMP2712]